MDYIHQAASIDDIEDRIIQTKRRLVFRITLVLFLVCKGLYLLYNIFTTNRITQLTIKMMIDMKIAFTMKFA